MDFYKIKERSAKNGVVEIYPDFQVGRSNDLMVRGKSFYAIWNEVEGLWSTDEYAVQKLVDADLASYKEKASSRNDGTMLVKWMGDFSSNSWLQFRNYMSHISDSSVQLDDNLTFSNTEVTKKDYASKRLPYPLQEGSFAAYDELVSTLYAPEERAKLEWAIGSVIAGDAKDIQKFIVLYGEAGAGKSTMLNIIQKLFVGYYTTFEAKALTSSSNAFSTEVFRSNPLVAIQHDGDLSKIEDNTKLNSIISHEEMTMNEKYKPSYMARVNCFLFMGTNKPVKITDAKSGIIRRLIDVRPTGNRLPARRYQALMAQIDFELGAIASHCLNVYREMGKDFYSGYRPVEMILQTDVFYNFIESAYYTFKKQDGTSLVQAYELYKAYCDEALVDFKLPKYKFREELKNYFRLFHDRIRVDGTLVRSYYSEFLDSKFSSESKKAEPMFSLVMDHQESELDDILKNCSAQYASISETPSQRWANVTTKLSDLDTKQLHYVKPPLNHIVIDFDLKDDSGEKSLEKNLEAASDWPPTYAEFSKGGSGVHLHYIYDGDPTELSRVFAEGIEIKVFNGDASLRRRLSRCNKVPLAHINGGLPLKEKRMITSDTVKSEKALRTLIERNLRKEIHPGTKPSIDFIHKILEDAYSSGLPYDVSNMRSRVLSFAMGSTNQSVYCIKLVSQMKFVSETEADNIEEYVDDQLIFYDVEVFPNLFVVCWKAEGPDKKVVRMINPTTNEIEELVQHRLVGFNCRLYDNHILYGRIMGYNNKQLYELSRSIIYSVDRKKAGLFGAAYNLSYADIYDFLSAKMSLKKLQIELGLHHKELGLPWDEDVPEELWDKVAEYCENDVITTEQVFNAKKEDFIARQLLSSLSNLSVNDTTQQHTSQIIFGNDKHPQDKFVYTDLSTMFPGYTFEFGKSQYKGIDPGEGGYVYAEPGMYENVAVLDVASMHPTSIIKLNLFGPYTKAFEDIVDARLAIKHKDYEKAGKLLGGRLKPYLENLENATALAYALKIVINTVYGLTSAKFPNRFRDERNKDNIVAKRGALFMINLKEEVQNRGFQVVHIKTDSIKIPNASPEIIQFIFDYGKQYGYTFEHETTYSKMCLVNDAVYIAKEGDHWSAVGAQFAVPYVFKTLFSNEPIVFDDFCVTKSVTTAIYLDMNENLGEDEHDYHFVGRTGRFTPVISGGGILLRKKDDKYYAVGGSKGYRWMESEMVKQLNLENNIDRGYYDSMVDEAVETMSKFGDVERFRFLD